MQERAHRGDPLSVDLHSDLRAKVIWIAALQWPTRGEVSTGSRPVISDGLLLDFGPWVPQFLSSLQGERAFTLRAIKKSSAVLY